MKQIQDMPNKKSPIYHYWRIILPFIKVKTFKNDPYKLSQEDIKFWGIKQIAIRHYKIIGIN